MEVVENEAEFVPQYRRGIPQGDFSQEGASGKNSSKGKGKGISFCNNCLFTLRHEDLSGFQITNGVITNSDVVVAEPGDIQICDNCKCSGTSSISAIASVEGECDIYTGIDVLEFTLTTTTEVGQASIICPDASYFATAACETFFVQEDGGARVSTDPPDSLIDSITVEGPTAVIQLQTQTYADCTVVCTNPNPPPPPPSKGGKGKNGSNDKDGKSAASFKSSKILRYYDPFENKFPL